MNELAEIVARLDCLPKRERTAFAATTAQRAACVFAHFAAGRPDALAPAVAAVWDAVDGDARRLEVAAAELERLAEGSDVADPHRRDFYAMHAVGVVMCAIGSAFEPERYDGARGCAYALVQIAQDFDYLVDGDAEAGVVRRAEVAGQARTVAELELARGRVDRVSLAAAAAEAAALLNEYAARVAATV